MKIIIKLSLVCFAILITSCSSKINLDKFNPHILQKTKYMPTQEQLKPHTQTKIIIANIDNKKIRIASRAKLGTSIQVSLSSILAKSKSVQVLKRNKKIAFEKMVKEEIKMAEISRATGDDLGQAQYIVTGGISNASYGSTYIPGYYYKKTVNGITELLYKPSQTIYKACASGNIKVLELPALDEKISSSFDECSRQITHNRSFERAKTRDDALVRDAGIKAGKRASYVLRNFFSKKGYIYEARVQDDKVILKTTLSTNFGAKQDKSVQIFSIEQSHNPLTNKATLTETLIGNGTISDQINSNFSWIIVDDVISGKNIHIGDYIKIVYKVGFWEL